MPFLPTFTGTKEGDGSGSESTEWMNINSDYSYNIGRASIAYTATAEAKLLIKTNSSGHFEMKYYINKGGSVGTFGNGKAFYDDGTRVDFGYNDDTTIDTDYTEISSQSFSDGDYKDGSGITYKANGDIENDRGEPVTYDRGNRTNFKLKADIVSNVDWRDQGTQAEAYAACGHRYQVKFVEDTINIIKNNQTDRLLFVLPQASTNKGKIYFFKNASNINDVFIIGGYGETVEAKNFIRLEAKKSVGLSANTNWHAITFYNYSGFTMNGSGTDSILNEAVEIPSNIITFSDISENGITKRIKLPNPANSTTSENIMFLCGTVIDTSSRIRLAGNYLYELNNNTNNYYDILFGSGNIYGIIFVKDTTTWYIASIMNGTEMQCKTGDSITKTVGNIDFAFINASANPEVCSVTNSQTTNNRATIGFIKINNEQSKQLVLSFETATIFSDKTQVRKISDQYNSSMLYVKGMLRNVARFAVVADYPPFI